MEQPIMIDDDAFEFISKEIEDVWNEFESDLDDLQWLEFNQALTQIARLYLGEDGDDFDHDKDKNSNPKLELFRQVLVVSNLLFLPFNIPLLEGD